MPRQARLGRLTENEYDDRLRSMVVSTRIKLHARRKNATASRESSQTLVADGRGGVGGELARSRSDLPVESAGVDVGRREYDPDCAFDFEQNIVTPMAIRVGPLRG